MHATKDLRELLPRQVKVGGYTFRLTRVKPGEDDFEDDERGSVNFEQCHMKFDETLSLQVLVNTLIHELQHAINNVYAITDGAQEEHVAEQSGNGWSQVWKDNPRLWSWLTRAWRELRKERTKE
jgi:hypothetical protein